MTKTTTTRAGSVTPAVDKAWQDVDACFGKFCLTAGIEAIQAMMAEDVTELCGNLARQRLEAGCSGYARSSPETDRSLPSSSQFSLRCNEF
ncbi:MAG: hypothetical protein FJ303_22325 [Planctomycetes bacterium]|nr:hypothetical protein [Planctomycetota bacterium]